MQDEKPFCVGLVFSKSMDGRIEALLKHGVFWALTKEDALGKAILQEQPENTSIVCRSSFELTGFIAEPEEQTP